MDETLLDDLKDALQVTWTDQSTDNSLNRMITRSQAYFNELCGTDFTFLPESTERELLMERCRYIWNNALDDFETNYHHELSRLIQKIAVDNYVPEVTTGDGTGTDTGNI